MASNHWLISLPYENSKKNQSNSWKAGYMKEQALILVVCVTCK